MTTILHKGITIPLKGELPAVGNTAPDATLLDKNMQPFTIHGMSAKAKVLLCMPSLDTSTCAAETRAFNEKLAAKPDVEAVAVTLDLPFAMRRFCEFEGITNVQAGSDFRERQFLNRYGVEIAEGKLSGLHARAVFVLDGNNVLRYSELVPDLSSEPDYEKAILAINSLL